MMQRQNLFWITTLFICGLLFWLLSPVLMPFIAGFALAYFLDPVADFLEARGMKRLYAAGLILLATSVVIVLAFVMVVPILTQQVISFAGDLPDLLRSLMQKAYSAAPASLKAWFAQRDSGLEKDLSGYAGSIASWTGTLLTSVWSGSLALVNVVSILFVTPVVAFYMLMDWDKMIARVDKLLPRDSAPTIRGVAHNIDKALAGFIRGQGTVCLLLGTYYIIALTLAGLKYSLFIGFFAGLLTFIPYVGALIGGLTTLAIAIVQFWPEYGHIAIIAGIFMFGQFVEGNFLSPNLVGESVGLHPVWLMFALVAFSYLFGFGGLLIAVPLAAAIGVLVRFAISRYVASPYYQGVRHERHKQHETTYEVIDSQNTKGNRQTLVLAPSAPHPEDATRVTKRGIKTKAKTARRGT